MLGPATEAPRRRRPQGRRSPAPLVARPRRKPTPWGRGSVPSSGRGARGKFSRADRILAEGQVVGRYVQTFDASSRSPFQRYIPSMRSAQDASGGGGTATPIYDALYSEYRRLFRTLPGDRT